MLTRAEVEELLPLYAGDDLEPELRARVDEALAADPGLRAALVPWTALEGLLTGALAPVGPPAHAAPARPKVHCPVCKDSLFQAGASGGSAAVVCAGCATPHHAGCFAAHGQCAVLGCESPRALGEAGAIPLRACAHCARETAAEAPFCAWCGTPREVAAPARPGLASPAKPLEPAEPLEVAEPIALSACAPAGAGGARAPAGVAAAALLLACGLGLGALLGVQQRAFLEALARESARVQVLQAELELPALLSELQAAQRAFRDEDLDGDGVRAYAPDLSTLLATLSRSGRGAVYPHLTRGAWRPWFAVRWGPPRDAESGRLLPSCADGYLGRVLPCFEREEPGPFAPAHTPQRRWAFDQDRLWEESPQEASGALGALLGTWRQALEVTPGVRAVAQRTFELELRVADGQDPGRLLRALPRELLRALEAQGLGVRISAPSREVAFYGDELLQGGDR